MTPQRQSAKVWSRRIWSGFTAVVVGCAVAISPASAIETTRVSGILCHPVFGQVTLVGKGEPGTGNFSSTTSVRVFCPFPSSYEPYIDAVFVGYYDYSTTSPFHCYVWGISEYGGGWWSPTRWTCGAFGCPFADVLNVGRGELAWGQPFGSYRLGSGIATGVSCVIPPSARGPASWVNWVAAGYD